jgi:hypothetical protein
MLNEQDEAVLAHVKDISLHVFEDVRTGFKFIMYLDDSNPHFTEKEIHKSFRIDVRITGSERMCALSH